MFKKTISILLVAILSLSGISTVFAASSFSDVDTNRYSWAITQIEEMAEKKILNGYPDGTFMPEQGVSKIEAMLLISRILGINEAVYADKLENIYALYADDLDNLNLKYGNEIAFLIYKGIFSIDEIKKIADDNAFNDSLYRYEVAEYLTRAMGGYSDATDTHTGYADESSIPSSSRAFVKYVKDKGIMQGMTETEFTPSYPVNRVQMAVMMYRVMNAQNLMFIEAEYNSVSSTEIEVKLPTGKGNYDITEAEFCINGTHSKASDFKSGANIVLVFENGVLTDVETLNAVLKASHDVSGEVKEVVLGSSNKVKIINNETGETEAYDILNTCEVYVDDEISTLSALRSKDYVKLYLDKSGVVIKVEILDVNDQFNDGVIKSIDVDENVVINIERKDGTNESYLVDDSIVVKRNSSNAVLKDVLVGDQITYCATKYNRITRLEVKSEIGSSKGKITEVVISNKSSIVVTKSGVDNRYYANDSLVITVDGKESTLYDLRVDMNVEIVTDSGTVTKIVATSTEETNGQISGIVDVVNTSYGFINIEVSKSEFKQVFVSNTTKITADGATTATKTIKNIKVGDSVVVIGKTVNGAFQATTIVILD